MTEHPKVTDDLELWIRWVTTNLPFDATAERRLKRRLDSERPQYGSQQELEDLRGVADPVNLSNPSETRTRTIAAVLARMWFQMRERERKSAWHAAQINHQQAERELSDFDESIGADRYEQRELT